MPRGAKKLEHPHVQRAMVRMAGIQAETARGAFIVILDRIVGVARIVKVEAARSVDGKLGKEYRLVKDEGQVFGLPRA